MLDMRKWFPIPMLIFRRKWSPILMLIHNKKKKMVPHFPATSSFTLCKKKMVPHSYATL